MGHVGVYGGGGGVIVAEEIERLAGQGRHASSRRTDGQRLGLAAMVNTIIQDCDVDLRRRPVARRSTILRPACSHGHRVPELLADT